MWGKALLLEILGCLCSRWLITQAVDVMGSWIFLLLTPSALHPVYGLLPQLRARRLVRIEQLG